MAKRISWIFCTSVTISLLLHLLVLAQEKSNIYQVQITHDTSGLHVTPCPLPGISGNTWRLTNSTSDTIYLLIPMCVQSKDPRFYFLATGDSVDHTIGIWDALVQAMMLRTGEIVQCDREHPPACPTLTSWGVLVAVGLITSSAIIIMSRRRKVTASHRVT